MRNFRQGRTNITINSAWNHRKQAIIDCELLREKKTRFIFYLPPFVDNTRIVQKLKFVCFDNVPVLFRFHKDPLKFQCWQSKPKN